MRLFQLLLFILACNVSAQQVEFLQFGDTLQKPEYQNFVYIDDKTDVSAAIFVGRLRSWGKLDDVSNLFGLIKTKAQEVGATSFRFESFRRTDETNGELILSVYFNEGDFFDVNFENLPKDKIFILGSPDLTQIKSQGFKVDGNKYEVESGKFREFDISEAKDVKINKGGFTGMTLWVARKEGGYSSFFGFSGIGLSGMSVSPTGMGGGIAINTGTIHKLEPNLALLLLRVYTKMN